MSITQQVITVAAGVLATMLTRFAPFIIFRSGKPTPKYIMYLGKVLPAAVFAMLVVYCLRNAITIHGNVWDGGYSMALADDAIAQALGVAATIAMHAWRKNLMWSIAAGTVCYMILVRI